MRQHVKVEQLSSLRGAAQVRPYASGEDGPAITGCSGALRKVRGRQFSAAPHTGCAVGEKLL